MKKQHCLLIKFSLYCICCLAFLFCSAQKGASFLRLNVPVQYAWYTVNVTLGASELRGEKTNQSINAGAVIGYEYFIKDRWSLETGIGISSVSFSIVRPFDRRFWGDLQRPVRVTHPRYSYSLLRVPLRVNYQLGTSKGMKYFVGVSNNLNFTFSQSYASDSRLNKFYLFSDAVELNARFQFNAGRKMVIAVEPNIQVYNQWKKDLVLSEYGVDVLVRPDNQPHYHKQFFDAIGIAFSAAYRF
jgi:hypothetical protein